MKYKVIMSCGHEEEVALFGKCKDRERKIEYFKESGLCTDCYKAAKEAAAKAVGLIFSASLLPYVAEDDGSFLVSVWFSGDTKPHKEEIKALGGYHWSERESAEDYFSLKRPPLCWIKTIKLEMLNEEVSKALSIGAKVVKTDKGFFSTVNRQVALLAQKDWKEKKDRIDALKKPTPPDIIIGHKWNQKIYGKRGGYSIYPDGEKTSITNEQADKLEQYIHDKTEYMKKVQEIRNSPRSASTR